MNFGYVRYLKRETENEIAKDLGQLIMVGAQEVYMDYENASKDSKPQIEVMLHKLQKGDTIIALDASKIAKNSKQLCEIIEIIENKNACLNIIDNLKIDCTNDLLDSTTRALINMSKTFSKLES